MSRGAEWYIIESKLNQVVGVQCGRYTGVLSIPVGKSEADLSGVD